MEIIWPLKFIHVKGHNNMVWHLKYFWIYSNYIFIPDHFYFYLNWSNQVGFIYQNLNTHQILMKIRIQANYDPRIIFFYTVSNWFKEESELGSESECSFPGSGHKGLQPVVAPLLRVTRSGCLAWKHAFILNCISSRSRSINEFVSGLDCAELVVYRVYITYSEQYHRLARQTGRV